MRFNLPACLTKTAQIAKLLGCDLDGLTQAEAAEQAVEAVQDLARQIGIPQQLRELGMSADQIPTVAEKAFQAKRILRVNPREISLSEMEEILHAAQ
jgi:alcohol dehydrogenase class IV